MAGINSKLSNTLLSGTSGNDSIYNEGDSVTVDAGDGNDTIKSGYGAINGKRVSLNGGNGNDYIWSYGSDSTITGGKGDDKLLLSHNDSYSFGANVLFQYADGDGNDTVYGFNETSTLNIAGTYSSAENGNDVIVTVGEGKIILVDAATLSTRNIVGSAASDRDISNTVSNTVITGSDNADTIRNYAEKVTIDARAGNDSVYNYSMSSDSSINGGAGDDHLRNFADKVTIVGGDGNDSIFNKNSGYLDGGTNTTGNVANNVSIDGGDGADSIENNGNNVTISGGAGDDSIDNLEALKVLFKYAEGEGNDIIYGFRADSTLSISGGSYSTTKSGSDIVVTVSEGKITLNGAATLSTLNIVGDIEPVTPTGNGKTFINYGKNSLVSGTAYGDTIKNYAGGVTIHGNSGNDSIYNSTGSDYRINDRYGYVTVDGGEGDDTINSYDPRVSLSGGKGNDKISIYSSDNYNGITINGGTGNDTIYGNSLNGGVLYQYREGDGSDVIYNFSNADTLSISGNSYTTTTSNNDTNDILIKLNDGETITIINGKDKKINIAGDTDTGGGTPSGKYITNYTPNSLVSGTAYKDTINNYAGGATIQGGNDGDYIYNNTNKNYTINSAYGYVTVDGGKGNDIIDNYDPRVSLNGGEGDDKISLYSSGFTDVTINAGTGDDTIYGDSLGGGVLYQYKKGDGDDIIYGYNGKDSITISGSTWTTTTSDNNVLVKVANSGTITLSSAKGKTVNIYPASDPEPTPPTTSVTPHEVIKKFMKYMDETEDSGMSALNKAVKEATGGYFQNLNAAVSQMVADCKSYNSANSSDGWNNFLKEKCGIILNNADTGAISGSDAGGSTVKDASGIVSETGSLKSSFADNSFTVNGLTVQLSDLDSYGNPYSISFAALSDLEKNIWQGLYTWWVKGALDLNAEDYGKNYSFTSSTATANKLYFGFFRENSGTMAVTGGWFADSSHKTINKLTMEVNTYNYNSLVKGDPDGKIANYDGFYLDRVLAHEFTHALMYVNVNYIADLPNLIVEGMAELTHGTDDDRKSEITALAKSSSKLQNALLYDSYDSYAGGYMFLRYLAKQGSEHYPANSTSNMMSLQSKSAESTGNASSIAVSIKGNLLTVKKNFADDVLDLADYSSAIKNVDAKILSEGTMIIGNSAANSVAAGKGNDTVFANTGNDKVYGGAGNDIIYGEAGNDTIAGEKGKDKIWGGTGNDNLTGGDGKDVFIFGKNSGKDVIADYTSGKDKIKFVDVSVKGSAVKGSDVVLYLSKDDLITVKDAKGKTLNMINSAGKSISTVISSSTILNVTNSTQSPVTVKSAVTLIDASSRTKAVKITGNKLANTITGGSGKDSIYGGAGNDSILGGKGNDKLYGQAGNDILKGGAGKDSLWGGSGNDSLWGDAGKDTFIYAKGDGKDVIYGFDNTDMLKITGAFSTSYSKSKKEIAVKVGSTSNAITLKDFSATTFNVNGTTYKISGSKLVKK